MMTRRMLWAGLVLAQCFLLAGASNAVTIETGPMAWELDHLASSGPDVAGGTFEAIDTPLVSFTLFLGAYADLNQSNDLRGIVMGTDATGKPTGSVLWESPSFEAIGARQEWSFNPGLTLVLGEQYFIGVDAGLYTDALGGDFTIQTSADSIPGGQYWRNSDGLGFSGSAGADVRTSIVLVHAPEPTTGLFLGLGLGLLGWSQKNNRARRHNRAQELS